MLPPIHPKSAITPYLAAVHQHFKFKVILKQSCESGTVAFSRRKYNAVVSIFGLGLEKPGFKFVLCNDLLNYLGSAALSQPVLTNHRVVVKIMWRRRKQ